MTISAKLAINAEQQQVQVEKDLEKHRKQLASSVGFSFVPNEEQQMIISLENYKSSFDEIFVDALEEFSNVEDTTMIELEPNTPQIIVSIPDVEGDDMIDLNEPSIGLAEVAEARSVSYQLGKAKMVQISKNRKQK